MFSQHADIRVSLTHLYSPDIIIRCSVEARRVIITSHIYQITRGYMQLVKLYERMFNPLPVSICNRKQWPIKMIKSFGFEIVVERVVLDVSKSHK